MKSGGRRDAGGTAGRWRKCRLQRCQAAFVPASPEALYCSDGCRWEQNNNRARAARQEHGEEPDYGPRYPDARSARAALLGALQRDGGWWGEPMIERWAGAHQVEGAAALELVAQLVAARQAEAYTPGPGAPVRWRARP